MVNDYYPQFDKDFECIMRGAFLSVKLEVLANLTSTRISQAVIIANKFTMYKGNISSTS